MAFLRLVARRWQEKNQHEKFELVMVAAALTPALFIVLFLIIRAIFFGC